MPKYLFLFLCLLMIHRTFAPGIKGLSEYVKGNYRNYEKGLAYLLSDCQTTGDAYFSCFLSNNRDAHNTLVFGERVNGTVANVTFHDDLSLLLNARFLELPQGVFLEVYASTSKGNGGIFLYDLAGGKLKLNFFAAAVDSHAEQREMIRTMNGELADFNWKEPAKNPEASVVQVSRFFKDDYRLLAHYVDLDNDGLQDLVLEGELVYRLEGDPEYLNMEQDLSIKRVFAWHHKKQTFIEDKSMRKGPDFYFEEIDG